MVGGGVGGERGVKGGDTEGLNKIMRGRGEIRS